MVWKRVFTTETVDAEVDLCNFSVDQLLQGLIDAGTISEAEAETLLKRDGSKKNDRQPINFSPIRDDDLLIARDEIRIGRRTEALIHIERYLGREFIGRLCDHGTTRR